MRTPADTCGQRDKDKQTCVLPQAIFIVPGCFADGWCPSIYNC